MNWQVWLGAAVGFVVALLLSFALQRPAAPPPIAPPRQLRAVKDPAPLPTEVLRQAQRRAAENSRLRLEMVVPPDAG